MRNRQSRDGARHGSWINPDGGNKSLSAWDGPHSQPDQDQNSCSNKIADRAHLNSPSRLAHRTMWRALAFVDNGCIRSFGM